MAFSIATLKILIECATDAHHAALYVVRVGDSNDLCLFVVTLLSLRAVASYGERVYSGRVAHVPHVRSYACVVNTRKRVMLCCLWCDDAATLSASYKLSSGCAQLA
jgi:hypothetical protein